MKVRLFKWLGGGLLLLGLSLVTLWVWVSWPTPSTLVGQASQSDIRGLQRSLFLGAEINGFSTWGWHGGTKGDTPLSAAVQYGNLMTVTFLLGKGADPNLRSGSGMPPLCYAAIHGRLDVVMALVEHGAEPNLPEVDHMGNPGKIASNYARSMEHVEIIDYLGSKSR